MPGTAPPPCRYRPAASGYRYAALPVPVRRPASTVLPGRRFQIAALLGSDRSLPDDVHARQVTAAVGSAPALDAEVVRPIRAARLQSSTRSTVSPEREAMSLRVTSAARPPCEARCSAQNSSSTTTRPRSRSRCPPSRAAPRWSAIATVESDPWVVEDQQMKQADHGAGAPIADPLVAHHLGLLQRVEQQFYAALAHLPASCQHVVGGADHGGAPRYDAARLRVRRAVRRSRSRAACGARPSGCGSPGPRAAVPGRTAARAGRGSSRRPPIRGVVCSFSPAPDPIAIARGQRARRSRRRLKARTASRSCRAQG